MKNLPFAFILFMFFTGVTLAQDPINVTSLSGDCSSSDFSENAFSQYDFSETFNAKPSYVSDDYIICSTHLTEAQCNTSPDVIAGYIIRWTGDRWEWLKGNEGCFWLIDECVNSHFGSGDNGDLVLLAYNTQDTTVPPENGWVANTGFSCVPAINATLGTSQTNFSKGFSVHPNPSNGKYNLIIVNEQNTVTVNLYNVLGQHIWSRSENNTFGFEFEIDQPNGLYFLELFDNNGKKELIRLIKY